MEGIYYKVIKMLKETAELEIEIKQDSNLFDDLKMDSIIILDIVEKIEEEWGLTLTENPELLDAMETVQSLVDFIESKVGGHKE